MPRDRARVSRRKPWPQVVHVQLFGATPSAASGTRPPLNFDVNENSTVGATLDIAIERAAAAVAAAAASPSAVAAARAAGDGGGGEQAPVGVAGLPRELLRLRRYDPVLAIRWAGFTRASRSAVIARWCFSQAGTAQ